MGKIVHKWNTCSVSWNQTGGFLWMDYTNFADHNSSYPGDWTDSFGRLAPAGYISWYNNYPLGSERSSGISYMGTFMVDENNLFFCDLAEGDTFGAVCTCHCEYHTLLINSSRKIKALASPKRDNYSNQPIITVGPR